MDNVIELQVIVPIAAFNADTHTDIPGVWAMTIQHNTTFN